MNRHEERALALAGIVQACHLVAGIARSGLVAEDGLTGSLESIFVTNPENTLDVYHSGNGVRTGLRLVHEVIGEMNFNAHGDTVQYTLLLITLERKLQQRPELMRQIGAGVEAIQEHMNLNNLGVTQEEIVERLSRLYEETAGTLEPRIRIHGLQKHLQNAANTCKIRALLLAGLRSAVLWRQLDGRKTQWVLGRGKLLRSLDSVTQIINRIN